MRKTLLLLCLSLFVGINTFAAIWDTFYDAYRDGIYYRFFGDEAMVTRKYRDFYVGGDYRGDVVIPETVTYDGKTYRVTAIGEKAFYYNDGMTSVTIPQSVTLIEDLAFYDCNGLTEITIPESVTTIGGAAFQSCDNLTSVTVRNRTPISIAYDTFYAVYENATLHVPLDCKAAYQAAGNWNNFKEIVEPPTTVTIDGIAYDICSVNNNINDKRARVVAKTPKYSRFVNIPSVIEVYDMKLTVMSIYEMAFFDCRDLTSVSLPETIQMIGKNAFNNCKGLTSITIPNRVFLLEQGAFMTCTGLTSVTIPESVVHIGIQCFQGCTNLWSVRIPSSVTDIGGYAFADCPNLTSVSVDRKTPIAISETTFSNRRNAVLHVPEGCREAYQAANFWKDFKDIVEPSMATIDGVDYHLDTGTKTATVIAKSSKYSGSVFVPSSFVYQGTTYNVMGIEEGAFKNCTDLTSVTITSGKTFIGKSAFSGCVNLTDVNIPDGIVSVGAEAFMNCKKLTYIIIPESVLEIGDKAFYGCTDMTEVLMNSETPIEITENTFPNRFNTTLYVPFCCKEDFEAAPYWQDFKEIIEQTTKKNIVIDGIRYQLNSETITAKVIINPDSPYTGSINIPASVRAYYRTFKVTSVGSNAFIYNSDLISVSIPEGVSSIGTNAFQGCTGLTSVTLPSSLTIIDNYAFYDCSNLKTILCYAEEPPIVGNDVFKGVNVSKVALYVRDESVELYKAHDVWKQFFMDTITGINEINNGQQSTDITPIYNLAGQRLQKMQKGINIVNGKKIFVK